MVPKEAFDGEMGNANAPEAPASVEQPNINPIPEYILLRSSVTFLMHPAGTSLVSA